MSKFRKKPIEVKAIQWDGKTPHEKLQVRYGELVYSESGKYYYVSHYRLRPDAWLPLSGENSDILLFAFYEVKSGRKVPLNDLSAVDLELVSASLKNYNPTPVLEQLLPWGYIEGDSEKIMVCVGDWIIEDAQGKTYPCKPDIFEATYEPIND